MIRFHRRVTEVTLGWFPTAQEAGWRADHSGTSSPGWVPYITKDDKGWRLYQRKIFKRVQFERCRGRQVLHDLSVLHEPLEGGAGGRREPGTGA